MRSARASRSRPASILVWARAMRDVPVTLGSVAGAGRYSAASTACGGGSIIGGGAISGAGRVAGGGSFETTGVAGAGSCAAAAVAG